MSKKLVKMERRFFLTVLSMPQTPSEVEEEEEEEEPPPPEVPLFEATSGSEAEAAALSAVLYLTTIWSTYMTSLTKLCRIIEANRFM